MRPCSISLPVVSLNVVPYVSCWLWPVRLSRSDIEEPHVLRVALDERATGLDVLTHEDREDLVGRRGLVERDLQQRAVLGRHRRLPQLLVVHLAQALVALDRVLLGQPLAAGLPVRDDGIPL